MYNPYSSSYPLYFPTYVPSSPFQQNSVYDYGYHERVLPPAEPESLKKSAENTKQLLADVQTVNETIQTSPTFAQQLVTAAQQSNIQTVQNLINQLPLNHRTSVAISPGGISITFLHKQNDCCYIVMFLNWREFF